VVKRMSDAGLKELVGHEGIVLTRFRDSVGVWTIGIGHTKAAGPPDPKSFAGKLTIAESLDLFRKDVARYEDAVAAVLKVAVSQAEFDALVSFHFNTGGIKRASLVKSINIGNKKRAAKEFMNWSKPPEIVTRRRKEQRLFESGSYSNGGEASIFPATQDGKVQWNKGRPHKL
jgi:lysozyme